MMSVHSNPVSVMFRGAALALTILVFVGGASKAQRAATQGSASSEGPFGQLAGSWSGSGTIDLSNGRHEPIKCRANYDVLEEQDKLQLNIHCASDSYNFDLRGSANYAGGTITGTWSDSRPATRLARCPAKLKASAFRSWRKAQHSPPTELGDAW